MHTRADTTFIGGVINLTSSQSYTNPVVLTNDTIILSTDSASITFTSTVDGPYNLTINTAGAINFDAAVGANATLTSLVLGANMAPGSVNISNAPVTTTGEQTYDGTLNVSGAVTLSSTAGGDITFTGIYGVSAGPSDLTVSSAGITTFSDPFTAPYLSGLTIGGGGIVLFNTSAVSTTAAQTYNESVFLTKNTTLTSSNITFASTVDGAVALTVSPTGNATFSGPVGSSTPLTSLAVGNEFYQIGRTTLLNASVTTSGSQTYGEPVILGAPAMLTSSTGNIVFSSSIDGPQSLTLNAPSAYFAGTVGSTAPLASLTVGGGGTVYISSNLVATTGPQIYNENVYLRPFGESFAPTNTTLTSLGGANITFGGTINGESYNALTVNTSGNTTFNGVVGGNELYSLTTSPAGSVTINTTSITTFADQSYGNVTLSNSVTISEQQEFKRNISFGTIDGAYNLTIYAPSGTNTFNGAIGSITPLTSLVTGGGGATIELNAASVTTTLEQFYLGNVLLETNVCLTNTDLGSIVFEGTVDGAQNLTVISERPGAHGTLEAVFDSPVGSLTPLSSLTVGGDATAALNAITTTGSQSYNENVWIGEPASCVSLGGGSITFADAVNGTSTLTLSTAGTANLNGPVGSNTPPSAFTVTGGANLAINGGLLITTGAQTYNEPTALGNDTTLSGSPLSLPALAGNDHVLTLTNAEVSALGGLDNGLAQLVIAGGGSVALDTTFSAPSVNVVAPATLTGSGLIIAPVTVQPGATLAPDLSSGPFTLVDSLTLSGATVMELNPVVPTNDLARTFGDIEYGGTLTVTNLGGALAAGDSFRLFEGGSYTGAFSNMNLPALPAGLIWDTRGLTNNGSILVAALPALTSLAMTGPDNFQLTATGMPNELYNVLASTNIALPAAQWWVIGSAAADTSGTINFTDSTATNANRFYMLGQ